MKYKEYQQLFDKILSSQDLQHPYSEESYLNYTKLNRSRMNRWDRQGMLDEGVIKTMKEIDIHQHWIIITEPWCGDAAHALPFLIKMVSVNNLITYDIVLRDTEPLLINSYLTNGAKSIPKLVVKDENGMDLFTWGPRPEKAQDLVNKLKAGNASLEAIKLALQHWYNEDKGLAVTQELSVLLMKYSITQMTQT